jgi:hypothetical protein
MSTIEPKRIKIMIETNGETNEEKTPFALTFSKIHNPVKSRIPANVTLSEYPFFTGEVPYPESVLAMKEYSELLRVFFDEEEFIRVIIAPYKAQKIDEKPNQEVVNKNIMIMLSLMFPTSPSENNVQTSYDKELLHKQPEFKFNINIATAIDEDSIRSYSYLNLPGGICTVSEVVWLNDVLNQPTFKELVKNLMDYHKWVIRHRPVIKKDIAKLNDTLLTGLKTPLTPVDTSSDEKKEGVLRFTEDEMYKIKKQKKMYSEEKVGIEITDVLREYMVVDPKEFETLVQPFVKSITQSIESNDKTVVQREIGEELKRLFEHHQKLGAKAPTFLFKNEEKSGKKASVDEIIKENEFIVNKIKEDMYTVQRDYQQYKKPYKYSYRSEYNDYVVYDTNIEKMVKDMRRVNETRVANDELIALIESIRKLYESTIGKSYNTGFSVLKNKIDSLWRMVNDIKILKGIEEKILSNDPKKGIFSQYESKIADDEETRRMYIKELENKKYAVFTRAVKYINDTFVKAKRESMNPKLQEIFKKYIDNKSSAFKTDIVDKVEAFKNEKKSIDFNDVWNVSVMANKNDGDSVDPEYEIYLYIEIIKGVLDLTNTGEVGCDYLDEKITRMFEKLTGEKEYTVDKSAKAFQINRPMATPTANKPQVEPAKTGGKYKKKTRRMYRVRRLKTRRYRQY